MELAERCFSLSSLSAIEMRGRAGLVELTIEDVINFAHRTESSRGAVRRFDPVAGKIARFVTLESISDDLHKRLVQHDVFSALKIFQ